MPAEEGITTLFKASNRIKIKGVNPTGWLGKLGL
jgi:hypothetical protein